MNFFTFSEFATLLGEKLTLIYEWDMRGYLPVTVRRINGKLIKTVAVVYALRVKEKWAKSKAPIVASKEIGIPPRGGSMSHLIEKKIVQTIYPLGNKRGPRRILVESIPVAQKYVRQAPKRLAKLRQAIGRKNRHYLLEKSGQNGHRWTSKEAREASLLSRKASRRKRRRR